MWSWVYPTATQKLCSHNAMCSEKFGLLHHRSGIHNFKNIWLCLISLRNKNIVLSLYENHSILQQSMPHRELLEKNKQFQAVSENGCRMQWRQSSSTCLITWWVPSSPQDKVKQAVLSPAFLNFPMSNSSKPRSFFYFNIFLKVQLSAHPSPK